MAALRWALYVERLAPILANDRETQAMTVDKHTRDLAGVLAAKQRADLRIPLLESVLYPGDDDAE